MTAQADGAMFAAARGAVMTSRIHGLDGLRSQLRVSPGTTPTPDRACPSAIADFLVSAAF
jgi:hypothetical protein